MTQQHIAVVDDEPDITRILSKYLSGNGFRVSELHDRSALMALMQSDPPDMVLLDIQLPNDDGLSLARHLREHWNVGIILVTGRADQVDKVVGLEVGADDYITKPFDLREMLARIKAVLRRMTQEVSSLNNPGGNEGTTSQRFRFSDWVFDCTARTLLAPAGHEVALTTGEFELLRVFVTHPGRVLSRDFLLESTRGRESTPFDRAVDVLVGRLRKKIETDPGRPEILKSVRSAGYVLTPVVAND